MNNNVISFNYQFCEWAEINLRLKQIPTYSHFFECFNDKIPLKKILNWITRSFSFDAGEEGVCHLNTMENSEKWKKAKKNYSISQKKFILNGKSKNWYRKIKKNFIFCSLRSDSRQIPQNLVKEWIMFLW